MNLKAAHLVAVQFGVFIGVVLCLVLSRFESARPRTAAEMREQVTKRAEPEEERNKMVDNRGDLESAEPLPEQSTPALPNQYSPEAVEKSMALLTKLYYEQIAPRRTFSSSPANTTVAPSYTEVAQEPAVVQHEDPAPQTVAYVRPTQFVAYPQPAQVIIFSHPRRLVNGCRSASPPGALGSNPHRRLDGGGSHLNTSPSFALRRPPGSPGVAHRRNTGAPSCPATQGLNPRGTR